ncbi:MAG: hypothetical protein ABSF03_07420 [Streptosporangiaceae bacterium]
MDTEIAELASRAAATLVGLLTTDAWERAKVGLGALWRRAHPERAETIEAEIIDARSELIAAEAAGDFQVERDLVDEWKTRVRRLLIANPDLVVPLRRLLDDELTPALPGSQVRIGKLEQHAKASRRGEVNQVGLGEQWIVKP